ncbi:MAG: hypothetical protein ABI120_17010 [Gemmatimonadaceae bacterium]
MKQIRRSIVLGFLLVGCGQVLAAQTDSVRTSVSATDSSPPAPSMVSLLSTTDGLLSSSDTITRRRALQYSDWYGTRASIHRRLSYAMLPLFAASYISGDKLFKEGSTASSLTKNVHRGSATAVSALFAVNTLTGGINLWQSRNDPAMRKRKLLHTVLFTAATAGFTYAGVVLADQAETSLSKRQAHRNVNLVSMGLSSASVLIMMVGPNR